MTLAAKPARRDAGRGWSESLHPDSSLGRIAPLRLPPVGRFATPAARPPAADSPERKSFFLKFLRGIRIFDQEFLFLGMVWHAPCILLPPLVAFRPGVRNELPRFGSAATTFRRFVSAEGLMRVRVCTPTGICLRPGGSAVSDSPESLCSGGMPQSDLFVCVFFCVRLFEV